MEYYFNVIEKFIMKKQLVEYPINIQDKVEYCLQDGKRLRPILCIIFSGIEINNDLDINNKIIYTIASLIEKIHCLSLVLDDLPEMDNDILRRGKQSFHSKYGVEYTNFFIYYMFTQIGLSLDIILDSINNSNADSVVDIVTYNVTDSVADSVADTNNIKYDIKIFCKIKDLFTVNLNMLIDGQYDDCNFFLKSQLAHNEENIEIKENNLSQFKYEIDIILKFLEIDNFEKLIIENIKLNMKKTSSLFHLSICSGFLLQLWKNKYELENYNYIYEKIKILSNILGYMFQISDDILDIYNDKEKGNPNLCNIIGKENTCTILKKGCKWLIENIKNIIRESNMILELNVYVINKLIVNINKRSEL